LIEKYYPIDIHALKSNIRVSPSSFGRHSSGESELSWSEVVFSLLLSDSLSVGLALGEFLSEDSGLSVPQVVRSSLLFAVFSCLGDSLLANDGKNLGNGLSHKLTALLQWRLTLILASLTWGAADTLLTLN
jgi:hypothetical protein